MALGPLRAEQVGPTWAEFLRSQAKAILATDFFTVTLLNGATVYVLAIIEHASQRVRILGVTAHPDNRWVTQMARNLIMEVGEHAEAVTFLIRDRDTKFTAAFDRMFADAGLKILRSPAERPARTRSWNGGSVAAAVNFLTAPWSGTRGTYSRFSATTRRTTTNIGPTEQPGLGAQPAVAVTERDGPEHGLASLEAIVGLERSHLWHAALADNLRRLGRMAEAAGELETAASLAPTEGERRPLLSRLLDVRS